MALTLRLTKGSPLTYAEGDANFSGLADLSLTTFTQFGTGAVARTAQAKLQDVINAADFSTLQQAVTAVSAGQTLNVDDDYIIGASLSVSNKTNIKITGKGSITLSAASSTARIFDLVGTINGLEISDLTLIGENNAAYTQVAIGNASGQTISNTWFCRNKISNINIGISFNAESGGSYTRGHALDNDLTNLVGTSGGQGYGIHLAKATMCEVRGNTIDNASRHAVYQAVGTDCQNIIAFNKIKNHRSSVFNASIRAALEIVRSSGVLVAFNTLDSCYDGGLQVGHDTSESANCSNIDIIGNEFTNRKNAISDMYVGENSVPTSYTTQSVRIRNNTFNSGIEATDPGGTEITVYNGKYIEVKGNTMRKTGVAATARFIIWGADTAISAVDDFNECSAIGNKFIAEGSVLTSTIAITVPTDVATGTSVHRLENDEHTNIAIPVSNATTPTNPNLMVITEQCPRVLNGTGASVGAGTTAGRMRTNAAVRFSVARTTASLASTDDFWNLSAVSTGVGEFRKVLLCVQSGSTARIVVGSIGATQAAAPLPRVPDFNWTALGVVEIPASYAGGALGATVFYDITGVYEQ